jgi:carbon monoxide dehydrogenase subunit G
MLRLVKWLFYLIMAAAVVLVAGSFLLPSSVTVTRSIDIAAPPEKIFALVGDLRHLNEFSPWADMDPATKYVFEGPETGVGQKMSWSSDNAEVGSGSQIITLHEPPRRVTSDIEFGQMGNATATWDLEPIATGTRVTWGFHTELDSIVKRWFGLMFDRWIGTDYEKGLQRLKAAAEAS